MQASFTLSNGRQLGYARYGQEGGAPAFYFHGLPGSRHEGRMLHEACVAAGVQLLAPERPGYGLSQPMPGPRLASWPQCIAELADHLGLERFHLFATSGGGPYALACASALSERVLATGICCGLGEIADAELRAGMRINARLGFWLAQRNPAWLRYTYGTLLTATARRMPGLSIALLALAEGQPDRSLLQVPWVRRLFAANLHEAFRQGPAGGMADMGAALEPWPFDLSRIQSLRLWHGLADRVVPVRHSQQLAQRVAGAQLQLLQGEGHFSLPIRCAGTIVRAVIGPRA